MDQKRFWDETPADDEQGTESPAANLKNQPVPPGKVPALDPDTGEWKPIREIETHEIGGHTIRMMEGPMVAAEIRGDDGKLLGTVNVPFDPDKGEPSDAELEEAVAVYHTLEFLRDGVRQDAIDAMVSDLFKYRADGARPLTDLMIENVSEIISEHVSITVTDDDGDLTPDQLEALQLEVNRLFAETLPKFIRELAQIPIEEKGGLTFWQQMAQDIITHALMYARNDAIEEYGGPEAVEALDDDTAAEWEARTYDLYKTGPYLSGALMQGWRSWLPVLGEITREGINYIAETPATDPDSMAADILKRARENLGLPTKDTAKSKGQIAPTLAPLFRDGIGSKPTHSLVIGARRALIAPLDRWPLDAFNMPQFHYTDANGTLTYKPSQIAFPDPQDAMQTVAGYGVGHQTLFKYITMRHLQGAHTKQQGPYGGFYLSIDEFLEARGTQKHVNGGYRPEDRQEVEHLMDDLKQLQVVGNHQRSKYKRRQGDKGLRIEAPLIVVSHTVKQSGLTPADDRVIAWYVRAGDWAAQMDRLPAQYGRTMQAIMQLHQKNDSMAIRLADALEEEFRKRATEGNWNQPYLVSYLFEITEEPINKRNPERNLTKLNKALDTLASPGKMNDAPMIRRWKPARKVDTFKRGWLDGWLGSGIVIEPAQIYQEEYKEIATNQAKKIEQNVRKKKARNATG